jgi:hypothetical protein
MSELVLVFSSIFDALSEEDYSSFANEDLERKIDQLRECNEYVLSEALYSKNEEIDEIPTASLKVSYNYA